jgi:hemerythrin superfamily protein
MDPMESLIEDHRRAEDLFTRFTQTTSRAYKTRQRLVDSLITELSVHMAVEEEAVYLWARALDEGLSEQVLERMEEHHILKWVLSELSALGPEDERFEPKVKVLAAHVRHHMHTEEESLFPQLGKTATEDQLSELAEAMDAARETAPTKPHPRMPDSPPANLITGPAAGAVDRLLDRTQRLLRTALRTGERTVAGARERFG